jgi:hypothetical protein
MATGDLAARPTNRPERPATPVQEPTMPKKQKQTKRMPANDLVKTSKNSEIELKEDELNQVTGGAVDYFLNLSGIKGEAKD